MNKRVLYIILCFSLFAGAQNQKVNWLSFEELEQGLLREPKKVLIYFNADWCVYCKKMDQSTFSDNEVNSILENNYYAVKFNVESSDTIYFGGKRFVNSEVGKRRNPIHDIPKLLAGRAAKTIELPALIFLDETFDIKKRFYKYIPPKKMVSILKE
jgi:thioredoxin-related protein